MKIGFPGSWREALEKKKKRKFFRTNVYTVHMSAIPAFFKMLLLIILNV